MPAESTLVLPGLIDAHVHLREPGATHKEDIASGTSAALAGGVLGVLDMPNNRPQTASRLTLAAKLDLFAQKAVSDYGLFVGYDGHDLQALVEAAPAAVGLKLYLDETYGDMTIREPASLAALFEAWPGPGPIAIHAESQAIRVAIDLAERYHQHLHVCHVPHPNELLRIESARQRGVVVTCEVTPHHLFLTGEDGQRLGPYGRMKPPLLSPADVQLFWRRLSLVDIIASDHAPHSMAEKDSPDPPPGVPGLETTLPLLLWAADRGMLTLERLQALTWHGPLHVFGLQPPADSAVEIRIGQPYTLPSDGYRTRCGWSPFAGHPALGRVSRVRLRGQTVWESGRLLARPGYGRPLTRAGASLTQRPSIQEDYT